MNNVVQASSEPGEFVVLATKPDEMRQSLAALSKQMGVRIAHWEKEKATLEKNLEIAVKNKLKQTTVKSHIANAQRRVEFYEKLRAAFDAGYVPVPNFGGVDVFAVRVKKNKPKENRESALVAHGGPSIPGVETDAPPLGEGKFVSPVPVTNESSWTARKQLPNGQVEEKEMVTRWAAGFDDEIDFPFVLTRPEIVEGAGNALRTRIFDELCVSPGRGDSGRRGDPMVLGRVVLRNGSRWQWRRVSFLVAWFIDTKDL